MTLSRNISCTRGHTLVELMIAVVLSLLVTAGSLSLYRSQRGAFDRDRDALQMREAGMTALALVGQQLQMTGFVPADAPQSQTRPALFGCSGGRPVGTDTNFTCEALASRSDGIAVSYVGDAISTWPSGTGQPTDCLGQSINSTSASVGAQSVPVVNRFFAKVSGSTGEPELYCEGSGKANSAQPLVEGVERVRARYWVAGAQGPLDANSIGRDQWPDVVAVDLCVLVRGAAQVKRERYLDCDGVSTTAGDTRRHLAFWRRVAIRNNEVAG